MNVFNQKSNENKKKYFLDDVIDGGVVLFA